MATIRSDRALLDELGEALREVYECGLWESDPDHPDRRRARAGKPTSVELHREAERRGITLRQVASHARVPGRWLIGRIGGSDEQAIRRRQVAREAEIHHLEREIAALRADRALEMWQHDQARQRKEPGHFTKSRLAEILGVSRPALDQWIADGAKALAPTAEDVRAAHPQPR